MIVTQSLLDKTWRFISQHFVSICEVHTWFSFSYGLQDHWAEKFPCSSPPLVGASVGRSRHFIWPLGGAELQTNLTLGQAEGENRRAKMHKPYLACKYNQLNGQLHEIAGKCEQWRALNTSVGNEGIYRNKWQETRFTRPRRQGQSVSKCGEPPSLYPVGEVQTYEYFKYI